MFEELYKLGSMIKRNTDRGRKGKISWWVPDELFNKLGRKFGFVAEENFVTETH
jgi:hypothetical protein